MFDVEQSTLKKKRLASKKFRVGKLYLKKIKKFWSVNYITGRWSVVCANWSVVGDKWSVAWSVVGGFTQRPSLSNLISNRDLNHDAF